MTPAASGLPPLSPDPQWAHQDVSSIPFSVSSPSLPSALPLHAVCLGPELSLGLSSLLLPDLL